MRLLPLLVFAVAQAAELAPSFANHALHPSPEGGPAPRLERVTYPDEDEPFTWDQTAVVRASTSYIRAYQGFDPRLQPVQINIFPSTPTNLNVTEFDSVLGLQSVTVKAKTQGLKEVFQFQALARGMTSATATFTYDIRDDNSRIRIAPVVVRSPGNVIKPGQIVRWVWTTTSNSERFAKCEAMLSGRSGPAKALGLSTAVYTRVLAVKAQPFVRGHYLMLVTPREVAGEPPRGSPGNGSVIYCAFGSENLAPVSDGFLASNFTPAVNETITLQPNSTDPETGRTTFNNQVYEFGDGTVASGVTGATTHAYSAPGIYRVRCAVVDDDGMMGTAEDSVIVGATKLEKISLTIVKQIPPEEAGVGLNGKDSITATFKDPSNLKAGPGDRVVFVYNRNHFGRTSVSDNGDITDIVLKAGGAFQGKTKLANSVSIATAKGSITVTITGAQFDRTGDPRLGRSELNGIFTNQRIAVAIIPADGSTPRALLYAGNVQAKVKGGGALRGFFVAEEKITATATTKQPDPKKQEPDMVPPPLIQP